MKLQQNLPAIGVLVVAILLGAYLYMFPPVFTAEKTIQKTFAEFFQEINIVVYHSTINSSQTGPEGEVMAVSENRYRGEIPVPVGCELGSGASVSDVQETGEVNVLISFSMTNSGEPSVLCESGDDPVPTPFEVSVNVGDRPYTLTGVALNGSGITYVVEEE